VAATFVGSGTGIVASWRGLKAAQKAAAQARELPVLYGHGARNTENVARAVPTPTQAADMLRASKPVGSALQRDPMHRAGDWVIDDVARNGSVFEVVGGDGVSRVLVQMPGEVNGVAGRFEWIMEGEELTHQLFVRGGTINGIPIKP